jgi:hypothetical protein
MNHATPNALRRAPALTLALSAFAAHAGSPIVATSCANAPSGRCGDRFDGATILIVTSNAVAGPGTLRQAIIDANADANPNIIGFNIGGSCPQTVSLITASPLPAITDSLSIRGYTQPGASPNTAATADDATICVQLRVSAGDSVAQGLRFTPTDVTDTFDVSGLSIGGFDDAIRIDGGNFTVGGNFLGVAADGVTPITNGYSGIRVAASNAYFATTRTIGGSDVAQRNLISGNGTGVNLLGGGGTTVRGNFIGTTRSGSTSLPNVDGVYLATLSNYFTDNVIAGNDGSAMRLEGVNAAANSVSNNRIGLKSFAICFPPPCTPDEALGNAGDGVRLAAGAAGNSIGGNAIAYNGGDGVSLPDAGPLNYISANAMHDNGGLGIDLGGDGVTPNDNDATAAAGAPNRLLNFPMLGSAGGNDQGGTVSGYLESTNGTYTIDFYADTLLDASLHGEGRDYLGSGEVTISNATAGNNGIGTFSLPVAAAGGLVGRHISAVAIDADGNTSEFSEGRTFMLQDAIFADGFD